MSSDAGPGNFAQDQSAQLGCITLIRYLTSRSQAVLSDHGPERSQPQLFQGGAKPLLTSLGPEEKGIRHAGAKIRAGAGNQP
jgi:hypothetical protein